MKQILILHAVELSLLTHLYKGQVKSAHKTDGNLSLVFHLYVGNIPDDPRFNCFLIIPGFAESGESKSLSQTPFLFVRALRLELRGWKTVID